MNNFGGMNRSLNIVTDLIINGSVAMVAIKLREPPKLRPVNFLKIREAHERSSFFIQL